MQYTKAPQIIWHPTSGNNKSLEDIFFSGSVTEDLFVPNSNMTALFIPRDSDGMVVPYYRGENSNLYFLGLVQNFDVPQVKDIVEFRSLGSSKIRRIFGYTNYSYTISRLYTPYNLLHAIYGDASNYDTLIDAKTPVGSGDDYVNLSNPIFNIPFSIVQVNFYYNIELGRIEISSFVSYVNAIIKSFNRGITVGSVSIVENISGTIERIIPLSV